MDTSSVRILVVDDHEEFRRFVSTVLQGRADLEVIGQASDGLEAVQMGNELKPDLILLDMGLPKMNGIEAAQRIRSDSPKSEIIFVSQESSADIVEHAFSVGASAYVVKMDAAREILAAVDAVIRGECFCGERFAGHNFTPDADRAPSDAQDHENLVNKTAFATSPLL